MEELSLNILDIAQNSVRANATRVDITVAELPAEDRLVITINDNGCGMTPEQVAHVEDPFYIADDGKGMSPEFLASVTDPFTTTRTTRKVGLGVPFFKMAALMTGGDFSIQSQVGKGTRVRAVFGLTHIDRMPLGNMADTMCILMGCNEQINFSFTYQVGEAVFTVSTAQLQEILDGVPLNTPQVMDFIRGYIKENMDLLSGGAS